jgi:hypothetical protein
VVWWGRFLYTGFILEAMSKKKLRDQTERFLEYYYEDKRWAPKRTPIIPVTISIFIWMIVLKKSRVGLRGSRFKFRAGSFAIILP